MNPVEELFNSVLYCSLFGDERDGIVARWNMLQVPNYYFNSTLISFRRYRTVPCLGPRAKKSLHYNTGTEPVLPF